MTEADFALLFREHTDAVVTILFGFVSITSGFLAASYLVAKTIPKFLAFVMVALYSVAALGLIGYCERHAQVVIGIRDKLVEFDANWHVAVTEPQFILPSLSYAMIGAMLAIYVACVWYFFYARGSAPK